MDHEWEEASVDEQHAAEELCSAEEVDDDLEQCILRHEAATVRIDFAFAIQEEILKLQRSKNNQWPRTCAKPWWRELA